MENPLSQNLLFLVMADISAIGRQRVKREISFLCAKICMLIVF